ncbi:hypothetical protein GCM10009642_24000 [Nocardiopsis metallicus]
MWLFECESQYFKDARKERIRQEVENTPAPTGAVGNPLPRTHNFPQPPHPDGTLKMR